MGFFCTCQFQRDLIWMQLEVHSKQVRIGVWHEFILAIEDEQRIPESGVENITLF